MADQILAPCRLNSRLEGQDQNTGKTHFLRQLIGSKGFAEAHLGVPQKLRRPRGAFFIGRAVIGNRPIDGILLFRTHTEYLRSVFIVSGMIANGNDCRTHIVHRAFEPLAAHASDLLAAEHLVNILIGERTTVRVHGRLPQDNTIGYTSVRSLGGILLRHTLVHIHRGIAHFQKSLVLRVGVLIGIDHRVRCRALGEECHFRHQS